MTHNKSIRILNTMNDSRIGGPQLRSLAVAKQLCNRGITTEFLLPDGEEDEFTSLATGEGFSVHRPGISRVHPPKQIVANGAYLFGFPSAVRRVKQVIDAHSIDVVHTNMSTSFCPAIAAARSDSSLIWHFNDTLVPRPIKNIAAKAAIRFADRIVVASKSVHNYYFSNNIDSTTIYPPVDVSEFDPSSVRPTNTIPDELEAENPIVIGTVANVNPIKGLEYFIRAIAAINEKTGRPVYAPIVGSIMESRRGYYEDLIDLCETLGVVENIHFLGKRDDIPELLAGFDLFVLASVAEACPMVVLEAMAMEKPVIATQVGGVVEQITHGKHGWTVPSEDSDAIAEAIMESLNNENEAEKRAKRARARVCSMFSLEKCVTKHEELYQTFS